MASSAALAGPGVGWWPVVTPDALHRVVVLVRHAAGLLAGGRVHLLNRLRQSIDQALAAESRSLVEFQELLPTVQTYLKITSQVGRLVQLKGFDLLIRAVARLPVSLRARLLIVGEGDQRIALEALIAELRLTDRVSLLGTQANPWKFMARADVVALASRSEAFPNVIGEALALSRPVIATNCSPGVSEYLDGGRYGVLVPPEDVDALARGLERILTDPSLRRELATHAASRVEAFGLRPVVDRYEGLVIDAARA